METDDDCISSTHGVITVRTHKTRQDVPLYDVSIFKVARHPFLVGEGEGQSEGS
jgi:hypothetical protein